MAVFEKLKKLDLSSMGLGGKPLSTRTERFRFRVDMVIFFCRAIAQGAWQTRESESALAKRIYFRKSAQHPSYQLEFAPNTACFVRSFGRREGGLEGETS